MRCALDVTKKFCLGCKRTIEEIKLQGQINFMKNSLRKPLLEVIEGLKTQGLSLEQDEASITVTYPEHPEVVVHISIGGLLYDAVEPIHGAN